jgi:hypothetical protein
MPKGSERSVYGGADRQGVGKDLPANVPGPGSGLKNCLEQIHGIDWKKWGNIGYNLELGVLQASLICRLVATSCFLRVYSSL